MGLTVDLETGRRALVDSVRGFVAAADTFDEWELLGASRCHGWTRLDVLVHVLAGWQEMLGGFVSPVEEPPTVDAASYWPAFDEEYDEDPVLVLMAQRRRTAVSARPDSARAQLREVADAVLRGARSCTDRPLRWQGHVFAAGDFLTIWAVEDVIHQADLLGDVALPTTALELARATVAELGGGALADRVPVPG